MWRTPCIPKYISPTHYAAGAGQRGRTSSNCESPEGPTFRACSVGKIPLVLSFPAFSPLWICVSCGAQDSTTFIRRMRHWQLAIGIAHNRSGHLGFAIQAAWSAKEFSKSENHFEPSFFLFTSVFQLMPRISFACSMPSDSPPHLAKRSINPAPVKKEKIPKFLRCFTVLLSNRLLPFEFLRFSSSSRN